MIIFNGFFIFSSIVAVAEKEKSMMENLNLLRVGCTTMLVIMLLTWGCLQIFCCRVFLWMHAVSRLFIIGVQGFPGFCYYEYCQRLV